MFSRQKVNQNSLTGVWLDGAKMDVLVASFPVSQDALYNSASGRK
jgi:hypothetical protein